MDVLRSEIDKLIKELRQKCYKRPVYDNDLNLIDTEYIIPRDLNVKHEYIHTQLKLSKMLQIYTKSLLEFLKEVYENDNFCFINYEEIKQK